MLLPLTLLAFIVWLLIQDRLAIYANFATQRAAGSANATPAATAGFPGGLST